MGRIRSVVLLGCVVVGLLAACSSEDATPIATATRTARQATRTPFPAPSLTIAPTEAAAATPAAGPSAQLVVVSNANLRAGPGTDFARVGNARAGDRLEVAGRNAAGTWFVLVSGAWIFGELVTGAPADVPVVEGPAASAPAAVRPSPLPARSGPPTSADSTCPCDRNSLNCDDFPRDGRDAQACYLRCWETTGRDVHGLDRDDDGDACEWTSWE